jgi:hypothetical protein
VDVWVEAGWADLFAQVIQVILLTLLPGAASKADGKQDGDCEAAGGPLPLGMASRTARCAAVLSRVQRPHGRGVHAAAGTCPVRVPGGDSRCG